MSDFNVESINYEYAHKCYMAYYTNSGTSDMIEKGKEVAQSDKWKSYIVKWQSEDSTIYVDSGEVDENNKSTGLTKAAKDEINQLDKTGADKSKKGGVAYASIGAVAGAAASATGLAYAAEAFGDTGSIIAAAAYCAVGAIFLGMTMAIKNQVAQNRNLQANYISRAEKDLTYNYADAQNKAASISEMVTQQNELQLKIQDESKANVGLSNAVADATSVSSASTNLAALGTGDEVAGGAYDELSSINDEMLTSISEYDQIMAEVVTNKSVVNSIKDEMPKFQKQRTNDKTAMLLLGVGAGLAALGGAAGVAMSVTNIAAPIIAAAVALFVAGIVLFGVSAVFALKENSEQKNALTKADETDKTATETFKNASAAASDIRSRMIESNTMYQNGQAMMEDFAEEDANHNGGPV